MQQLNPNTENDILRELENHYGGYSREGYRMKRAAEMFFPVWEKDESFFLLEKCCEAYGLDAERGRIIRECMEKHGMKEKI